VIGGGHRFRGSTAAGRGVDDLVAVGPHISDPANLRWNNRLHIRLDRLGITIRRVRVAPRHEPVPDCTAASAWIEKNVLYMRFIHLFLVGYFILPVWIGLALWQTGMLNRVAPICVGVGTLVAIGVGIMLPVSSGKPAVTEEIQP